MGIHRQKPMVHKLPKMQNKRESEREMNSLDISHMKDYRKLVIIALGGKCAKCGTVENLVIHHKRYNKNVKLEDVELRCKNCHPAGRINEEQQEAYKGGKFSSRISKFVGKRKSIEVPYYARNHWPVGTKVLVEESK